MSEMRRVIFDTSVVNGLLDGGTRWEPLLRGLESGYELILPATVADEIVSTKRVTRRSALLSLLDQFLRFARFIMPPHEIVTSHAGGHAKNAAFDWTVVDVGAHEYDLGIPERDFDESLCLENRAQQFELQKRWEHELSARVFQVHELFAKNQSLPPADYHDYAARSGLLMEFARQLYEGATGTEIGSTELGRFIGDCPPFRAVCYALVMASYNSLLPPDEQTPRPPGRIDLLMAGYLPYCSVFLTCDWPQRRDLVQVAHEALIDCQILSLEQFENSCAPASGRSPASLE